MTCAPLQIASWSPDEPASAEFDVSRAGQCLARTAGRLYRRRVSFDVGADAYGRFMGRYSQPLAAAFVQLSGVRSGPASNRRRLWHGSSDGGAGAAPGQARRCRRSTRRSHLSRRFARGFLMSMCGP